MECLDPGLVYGDIKEGAEDVHIGSEGYMQRTRRKTGIPKQILKLRWPLLTNMKVLYNIKLCIVYWFE